MHPLYNPSSLSDDELLDKLGKAYEHLSFQSHMGHQSAVDSISAVIDALEHEKSERTERQLNEELKKRMPKAKPETQHITLGEIDDIEDIY